MNEEITLRPLTDEDIPLLATWLDKEYIRKWFKEKEPWLHEIGERAGTHRFMTHFIVCHNDRRIGYCLHTDCFFLKNSDEKGYAALYENLLEENHTYEIGYLIGEEEYLRRGIGRTIVRMLEEKIVEIGGKELSADPDEANTASIDVLLNNGFYKKGDGDYRKTIA